MNDEFHYPPDLFDLIVEALARLNRAKSGVLLFCRGAGVSDADIADMERAVRNDAASVSKFDIARNVLTKVNTRGDSGLRPRREIIKRIVEFEDFSRCWPDDQLKARGLVAAIREAVNKRDSFTRMKQERDTEREQSLARRLADNALLQEKRSKLAAVSARLASLFAMEDKPQERGKELERVLNDLFRAYDVHLHENFCRKDKDTSVVLEQLDGVIELDGSIYLVEMKWLKEAVGVGEFFPHLSRLFLRDSARGIFISSAGFTEPVVKECTAALTKKTMILCGLDEIVMLLQRQDELAPFLKRKVNAAIVDRNPQLRITS